MIREKRKAVNSLNILHHIAHAPRQLPHHLFYFNYLMFQKKMTTPKFVIFESDPALIKRSGDNSSYIYNPASLFYFGPNFDVVPGEPVMIIPYQPYSFGPWKQCRIAFEDGRFFKMQRGRNPGHHD